jgi:hypothetical protein
LVRGGFGRRLDAEQVILYRDDWDRTVARRRAVAEEQSSGEEPARQVELELPTSIAEIYRENEEWLLLVFHYGAIGNTELRDKYVDVLLSENPSDDEIIFLRDLQGRLDLVPSEVIHCERSRWQDSDDELQRARFYVRIGAHREAVTDYAAGIAESIAEGNTSSAAYYLKELSESGLADRLFREALAEAAEKDDLWWQVRALQELGWDSEMDDLLRRNEGAIETTRDPELLALLASAKGDEERTLDRLAGVGPTSST